jgi:hypothetical protein
VELEPVVAPQDPGADDSAAQNDMEEFDKGGLDTEDQVPVKPKPRAPRHAGALHQRRSADGTRPTASPKLQEASDAHPKMDNKDP